MKNLSPFFSSSSNLQLDDDIKIIQFTDNLLNDALKKKASDIHCEPGEKEGCFRFRIDGLLYKQITVPMNLFQRIIMRFKIIANLDTGEKRLPQDGRFHFEIVYEDDERARNTAERSSDSSLLCSNQLDAQQGASDVSHRSVHKVHEDGERARNTAERSSGSSLLCSNQLDAQQGASDVSHRSVHKVHEDGERARNTAERSSGKSIIVDCRVSTCPTISGEKIVIRLLSTFHQPLQLHEIGLEPQQYTLLSSIIYKPHGLVIVCGPTGSGKTLTLYSILNAIYTAEKNISTVEDPVEMLINGINQTTIQTKIGLNFSTLLRALLRQDPDVIMIGEIRDEETAHIAMRAAQTGHFVLTTLHTYNTAESLLRLINLGISLSDLICSLSLIMAQRLVRKMCKFCNVAVIKNNNRHVKSAEKKCSCHQGYAGRTGIFELMVFTEEIKDQLIAKEHPRAIYKYAQHHGMLNLYDAGLEKVQQELTSLEELNRVMAKEYAYALA